MEAAAPPVRVLPRASLGALALLHAAVYGAAAFALPWSLLSAFAVLACVVAASFLGLAACAALAPRHLPRAFRATAIVSLAFLGWATWELGSAAAYLVRLYAGVGAGLAGAAGAAWCVIALFSLPLGVWGLAATGGVFPGWVGTRRTRARAVVAVVALALAVVFVLRARAARGAERVDPAAARGAIAKALALEEPEEAKKSKRPGSLFLAEAAACDKPPGEVPVTIVAVARAPKAAKPVAYCFQDASLDGAAAQLAKALRELGDPSALSAAIDVMAEVAPIADRGVLFGAVAVRPGADGVCFANRCMPPWQAVALQQFTTMASFPSIQLDLGATAGALKKALGAPVDDSFRGLSRWSGAQLLLQRGKLLELDHGRLPEPPPVDESHIEKATRDALAFIIGAQDKDGRFRYLVDPHTGETSYANFSVPRQAGTTLAVCEMGELDKRATPVATKSLDMLATLQRAVGERTGIAYPKGSNKPLLLGNTALSMIAFVTCRDRVGTKHDALIHGMGRMLLDLQRDDGGFAPAWDPASGRQNGPDPMYAEGQAVMALVLWEAMLDAAETRPDGVPAKESLRAAIDRAMDHFAGPYWDIVVRDFFFMEENWHCLAARAAMATHRNAHYETFCLDYVKMKSRFIFQDVAPGKESLRGAYGFGTVFPPHNTATAGFAEALAAAITVASQRKVDVSRDEALLRSVLAYLMRQQWNETTCFACTDKLKIPGGFSEHFGEPMMRIDYAQHAMAGLGHGGQALGLLPTVRAAGRPKPE